MDSLPNGRSAPLLAEATGTLERALAEACAADVHDANTGELMRIERKLVLAADAAERAVAIRRQAKRTAPLATPSSAEASGAAPGLDPHRVFVDASGVTWDAFAVHPTHDATGKARLPGPYQDGWLSFDSGTERRRSSPIPDDWQLMSDEELDAVCQRAVVAPTRIAGSRSTPPGTTS